MTAASPAGLDLGPNERLLGVWPAELARTDGTGEAGGSLVLTSERVAFYRRGGLFRAGPLQQPPRFVRRLEEVRSVTVRRYAMKIGYGDRVEIPGIAVDDQGFRLNRESSSDEVRSEIEAARHARRS